MILISVDLPAPFSPSRARTSPEATRTLTSCSTRDTPNDLSIADASSAASTSANTSAPMSRT